MPGRAIEAIFYTRFHHEKGSRVLHQVPAGSINESKSPSALPEPLFKYSSVTQYLIPTQQFCDRLLTFCVNHHRVIGYPVCIREGKYSRNEFIFNFAIVIGESEPDWACYGEVVRKLGRLLRGLEEQGGFLSREEVGVWDDDVKSSLGRVDEEHSAFGVGGGSKVYALCEMVLEDLNNYAECMIPIDDSNTINLKLFPTRPPPPPILAHQVPLLTISLSSLQTPISSDLTLNRVLPYINGINSISRIAQLADTDLSLTRRAIQHLVYYGCLVLLDIFSFGAIYACTAEIGGFVVEDDIKDECAQYVRVPRLRIGSDSRTIRLGSESEQSRDEHGSRSSSAASQHSDTLSSTIRTSIDAEAHPPSQKSTEDPSEWRIDHTTLIQLYTSLRQGLTLKNWVLEHLDLLSGIDVRRLITFGIIKGFLYRVHKYALATNTSSTLPPAPPTSLQTSAATSTANLRDSETATLRNAHAHIHPSTAHHAHQAPHTSTHGQHPSFSLHRPSVASTTSLNPQHAAAAPTHQKHSIPVFDGILPSEQERQNGLPLLRFLDGMHCFDEICTELGVSEREVEGKVRGVGGGNGGEGLGVVIMR
ncbi:nitrogen permease regulator 2 [Paraphoma chrysanthemicola]|nr:nitrogen permease regulator 2 [Paraphoma chrysanthemicola]